MQKEVATILKHAFQLYAMKQNSATSSAHGKYSATLWDTMYNVLKQIEIQTDMINWHLAHEGRELLTEEEQFKFQLIQLYTFARLLCVHFLKHEDEAKRLLFEKEILDKGLDTVKKIERSKFKSFIGLLRGCLECV